jgi:FlaG/FlaF family flagellin (archaellin)
LPFICNLQRYNVALVVNGAAASAWIDGGVSEAAAAASSAAMTIAAFSTVNGPNGVVFGGAGGFSGRVDEVKVWTTALAGTDWLPAAMWDRADVAAAASAVGLCTLESS